MNRASPPSQTPIPVQSLRVIPAGDASPVVADAQLQQAQSQVSTWKVIALVLGGLAAWEYVRYVWNKGASSSRYYR